MVLTAWDHMLLDSFHTRSQKLKTARYILSLNLQISATDPAYDLWYWNIKEEHVVEFGIGICNCSFL